MSPIAPQVDTLTCRFVTLRMAICGHMYVSMTSVAVFVNVTIALRPS